MALRSDLWCSVFLRRHNDLGHICVVLRRGDPIAGQVFIEVDHLDGSFSLFMPAPLASRPDDASLVFQRRFHRAGRQEVADRIAREMAFDPDLWVLSLEMRGDDVGIEVVG